MSKGKGTRRLIKIPFIRQKMYDRAVADFMAGLEAEGILLRNDEVPARLGGIRTLMVDASLVMEGRTAVRLAAAPLRVCGLDQLRHAPSWMMLTAGVALGCEGNVPLEQFVQAMGFSGVLMARQYPRLQTLNGDEKIRTSIHRDAGNPRAFAHGSVAAVMAHCGRILDGRERPMSQADMQAVRDAELIMRRQGLRTLAFATRSLSDGGDPEVNMTYMGMIGVGDMPYAGVEDGMDQLRHVGVRPVLAAGREVLPGTVQLCGVLREMAGMMGVDELDALDDHALREAAVHVDAYLGVDWSHKVRIARALRTEGLVGTLALEPNGGGLVLALGGGAAPDAVLERGDLEQVADLLQACRRLEADYEV